MGQHDPSVFDGTNRSPVQHSAVYDGHRSVRLALDDRKVGLATTTYSYGLSHQERADVARRIAAMWNLHVGVSTEELEAKALAQEPAA